MRIHTDIFEREVVCRNCGEPKEFWAPTCPDNGGPHVPVVDATHTDGKEREIWKRT